jgi:hypothetical protein
MVDSHGKNSPRRGRPKGRKDSRPRPKHTQEARAVIKEVTARANELQMPVREVVERAFRAEPQPDIDPSTLLKQFMLKNARVFLWAMEHVWGKPKHQLETTGAGGGPMELKVVIERIGGKI